MADDYNQSINELVRQVLAGDRSIPVTGGDSATETTLAAILAAYKAEDTAAVTGDKGIPVLAMRQLADTTSTDADGDYTLFKIDEEGRVKVATKPASFALVTGSITANAQTVFCDVTRASNVQIHMVATSLVGHNVTFEGSIDSTNGTDGTWFAIQLVRSNANTIELTTGVLAATPAYAWEGSVNGLSFIRVRATAHTSGTALWKFQRGSYATEPIPAAQISGTQPVSLAALPALVTGNARVGHTAASGVWYDDSSTTLAGATTFTGTSRDITGGTAAGSFFGGPTDVSQEVVVGAESDVIGTLWLEVSRDNTNWRRIKSIATSAVTGGGFYAEIVHRPSWRYLRVGYTNGAGAQARFTIGTMLKAT